ncbi:MULTISPECIES: DUF4231 domain-containing protein [Streptomyces]|uniref:DUF4231 domain-containing protein n=1 Tax=Streptomyces venezuelae (strain ATCC 10712 / CBS 650.69 / DSM 40230 / JCM 4526 / NBRC 13096 / PD 04745) TaxID=953739 RepID=F2RKW0_STRVP|nr:DUF4231 domain-containing protein [Streptomyces venezuelae]CCA55349.1 hypothetical protein SVEN_2063 [Streptomyces venezuelae ATCC 10712]
MAEVGDAPGSGVQGGEMTPQRYVETRVSQYQEWYDVKATRMKAMHLRMRTVSVVGGALVPVFVNLDLGFARVTATVLSVVVVAAISLESVYRYREQWKNYRSTEQLLGHERVYFEARVGPYHGLSRREAFQTLVARVEKAIANENSATLNVMTLGGQVSADVQQGLPAARAAETVEAVEAVEAVESVKAVKAVTVVRAGEVSQEAPEGAPGARP